jgi:DNA-binding winged helix-turn-helix (wHTH) protein
MSLQIKPIYEFGRFRIDKQERTLSRDGSPVPLTPKAFDVLLLLVESRGHIVGKDELLNQVWADSFVEEGNLKVTVSMLRKVLEEGAGERQYIETVPRRGYRFVASVKELSSEFAELVVQERTRASVTIEESEESEEQEYHRALAAVNRKSRVSMQAVIACVAVVGVVIAGVYLWTNRLAPGPEIKSIVVLPFRPIVADSRDESLEMGIAETLITKLSNRGDATNLLALLGVAYAKSGDKSRAQNVLDKLNKLVIQKRAPSRFGNHLYRAWRQRPGTRMVRKGVSGTLLVDLETQDRSIFRPASSRAALYRLVAAPECAALIGESYGKRLWLQQFFVL